MEQQYSTKFKEKITEQRNILTTHVTYVELMFRIYKELLKTNRKMIKISPDIILAVKIKTINYLFWILHTHFKKR